MAGDLKEKLTATSTLVTTALQSLASSQDFLAGWSSAAINNTSALDFDAYLAGLFTTHASNRQAGQINVYVVGCQTDAPTWPPTASGTLGTEGAVSFTDTEERDSVCTLIESIIVDSTASAVMTLKGRWIANQGWLGKLPPYFCLYISHNCSTTTTAGLASSGNALYLTMEKGQYT